MQFYLSHNAIRPHHFSNILAWLRLCIMGAGSQFRSLNKEHEAMFFLRSLAVLAPTRQPSAHPIHWSSMLYQSAPLPSLPQGSCGLQCFWFDLNLCFFLSLSLSLFLSPLSLFLCQIFGHFWRTIWMKQLREFILQESGQWKLSRQPFFMVYQCWTFIFYTKRGK